MRLPKPKFLLKVREALLEELAILEVEKVEVALDRKVGCETVAAAELDARTIPSPAAFDKAVETEAGIMKRLAPTLLHKECAKEVAMTTSEPEQARAKHPPTSPAH